MKIKLSQISVKEPITAVFSDEERESFVVISSYTDMDDELVLYVVINSISPEQADLVGTFEADSISDFNHGMIDIILKNGNKKSKIYKLACKAKKEL